MEFDGDNMNAGLIGCLIAPYENASFVRQCLFNGIVTTALAGTAYALEHLVCKKTFPSQTAVRLVVIPFAAAAFTHRLGLFYLGFPEKEEEKGYTPIRRGKTQKNKRKIDSKKRIVRTIAVISGLGAAVFCTYKAPYKILTSIKIMGLTTLVTFPAIGLLSYHARQGDKVNFWVDKLTSLFVGFTAGMLTGALARATSMKSAGRVRDVAIIIQVLGCLIMSLPVEPREKPVRGIVGTIVATGVIGITQLLAYRTRVKNYDTKLGVLKSCGFSGTVGCVTWIFGAVMTFALNMESK